MIKKVKVEDLRVGVYIHDFNCQWNDGIIYMEPDFIKDENVITILKSWKIREVFIDTDKGLDVKRSESRTTVKKEIGEQKPKDRLLSRPQVPLAQELNTAKQITQDAEQLLQRVARDVQEGKTPDISSSYELTNRMYTSIRQNRDALLLLSRIRTKDEYTMQHSISVSSLVINLCSYCQMSESKILDLAVGALFHDIGKAAVPQDLLTKPAQLSKEEFVEMRRHAEYSANLLAKVRGLPIECYDIALHHHERYDGSGYPHGLKGDAISHAAQLTAVCDVFDAMTSDRCYKPAIEPVAGLREIYEARGTSFHQDIAGDFIQSVGIYPVGTPVVLANGTSGVVVGSTDVMMRPVVQIFYDEKKQERIKAHTIDLSKTDDVIASYGEAKKFGLTSGQLLTRFLHQQPA